MDWKDEEVQQCQLMVVGGVTCKTSPDVAQAIMTRAVELAAARGGTMTVAEEQEALIALREAGFPVYADNLADHIASLGARNAVLEERLASAVKALDQENGIVAQIQERLSAAEEGNRELVRRAQQAEAHRDSWRDEHGASMRRWKTERENAETWRRRIEAAAEELADVGAGEVGRLDIVSRVRLLKARYATLSAAGQALSAHVDKAHDVYSCHVELCEECMRTIDTRRYPCSPTCTHDDAKVPGHPERVKERSEGFSLSTIGMNPDHPVATTLGEVERVREIARGEGAKAMRAACWEAVQGVLQESGNPSGSPLFDEMKSAIEGAAP